MTAPAPRPTPLAEAIGGIRGLIDSGAPTIVFIVVAALSTLRAAVFAALGAAVLLAGVRLARRGPVRYAVSGVLGVGISAWVAMRTGKAEGFFLPGIAVQAVYGLAFLGSILIRRPLVGIVVRALGLPAPQRRVAVATTAMWAAVFMVRAAVQGGLYLAGEPGWLAAVRIGMGWPLTFLALAATAAAIRQFPAVPNTHDEAARNDPARTGAPYDSTAHDSTAQNSTAQNSTAQNSVGTEGSNPRSAS